MEKDRKSQNTEPEKDECKEIKKWSIRILLIFFLIPVAINLLAFIPNPFIKGDPNTVEATWINFWGSYLGGFLSALIGAGISAFVAYRLISTQAEANRNSQILQEISLAFNREFQVVKQHIIQNTVKMHTLIQQYHMRSLDFQAFVKDYDELMGELVSIQTELHTVMNSNVVVLQFIAANDKSFVHDGINNKLARCALNCNRLRELRAKSTSHGECFDIVEFYNTNCLQSLNELRSELTKFETSIINTLLPVLKTTKNFDLPKLEAVEETDYDAALEKTVNKLQ